MSALATALHLIEGFNSRLLAVGRHLAWILVALMVATILLQVFMRYVVGSALPWPEELARAFMIWMMALVAGSGYRWGAFVSIDLVGERLPRMLSRALELMLLVLALVLMVQLFVLALEFFERGFRTRAASFKLSRAWIYLAMPVCFGTMILVNLELLLRAIGRTFGDPENFPAPPNPLVTPDEPGNPTAGTPLREREPDRKVRMASPRRAAPPTPGPRTTDHRPRPARSP